MSVDRELVLTVKEVAFGGCGEFAKANPMTALGPTMQFPTRNSPVMADVGI